MHGNRATRPMNLSNSKPKPKLVINCACSGVSSDRLHSRATAIESPVDDQAPRREVLVVPIQHTDPRTPVQKLPSVAKPAENPLGRS